MIQEGTVELLVTLGTYQTIVVIMRSFIIVKTCLAYNTIYSQPLLNAIRTVPSPYHQIMKFLTSRGSDAYEGINRHPKDAMLIARKLKVYHQS